MPESLPEPGTRVQHPEFGTGIAVRSESGGFLTVFFQTVGERRVPASALATALSWNERVVSGLRPADGRSIQRLWLALEADLDRFDLGDYRKHDDEGVGMERLIAFVKTAAALDGTEPAPASGEDFVLSTPDGGSLQFTPNRDKALQEENLQLVGLEHPVIQRWLLEYRNLPPEERAVAVKFPDFDGDDGLLTWWHVTVHSPKGQVENRVVTIGLTMAGDRHPYLERQDLSQIAAAETPSPHLDMTSLVQLLDEKATQILHREIQYSGLLPDGASYSSRLVAAYWVL